MNKYMIAYYGGDNPASKEEGMKHREEWQKWIQSLGDKVVNPGTPLPSSMLVTAESVEEDTNSQAMKGFAVVQAETMDAAVEIAKADPFLKNMGGTIRVSQMMEMK